MEVPAFDGVGLEYKVAFWVGIRAPAPTPKANVYELTRCEKTAWGA